MQDTDAGHRLGGECIWAFVTKDTSSDEQTLKARAGAELVARGFAKLGRLTDGGG